ncbi:hypothetical protein P154DRAFT_571611 [Amniculicola lignicola CBS 123094]|uniref:Uncharacterized protein n=1 Tax=Amniculicola lignicola CBS 123094 TaxID=1392246 RepID=A0A6A5WUS5_9PLEO|nr:hypothetical protein P154DRAFT_571611 [Amniculicola lignicola CBS 123094]
MALFDRHGSKIASPHSCTYIHTWVIRQRPAQGRAADYPASPFFRLRHALAASELGAALLSRLSGRGVTQHSHRSQCSQCSPAAGPAAVGEQKSLKALSGRTSPTGPLAGELRTQWPNLADSKWQAPGLHTSLAWRPRLLSRRHLDELNFCQAPYPRMQAISTGPTGGGPGSNCGVAGMASHAQTHLQIA